MTRTQKKAAAKPARKAGTPGRREANKLDKLRRIKDAARKLFVSKGFDETTIREIAAAAEVGLGTVFVYAANKRDLLFLLANEGLEDLTRRAETSVDPDAPLIDNLIGVFRHHYRFFAAQPAISRFVLREMTFYESGVQVRRFQKTREAVLDLLEHIVRLAAERQTIASSEAPDFIGWTAFSIYQVELRRWLSGDDLNLGAGIGRLRRALTLFVTGVQHAAARKSAPVSARSA
jgi:AcrR family transcriptional regulator